MGNYSVLTKEDRDLLKENGIAADSLVVAHRSETTTCYLNHKTRDNILLAGKTRLTEELVRVKRKTKEILRRNGIDPAVVDVATVSDRAIRMVHKTTMMTIYLPRGDRKW